MERIYEIQDEMNTLSKSLNALKAEKAELLGQIKDRWVIGFDVDGYTANPVKLFQDEEGAWVNTWGTVYDESFETKKEALEAVIKMNDDQFANLKAAHEASQEALRIEMENL